MTPGEMVAAAYKQQQLTGRKDAAVSFMLPGKWPIRTDTKRLFGRKGPIGQCVAEYEDAVLVAFQADEVITACAPLLPTISLEPGELGAILEKMKGDK